MEKVQPKEIRIVIDGGLVQKVGLGKDVPRDLTITTVDLDIEGQTPDDDPRIERTGYGSEIAFCAILHEPGDEFSPESIDEDGTIWL